MPEIAPKVDERDSLLEQIRTKVRACNLFLYDDVALYIFKAFLYLKLLFGSQSFNLKPTVATRPSMQGPRTNMKLAAILEKANAIRQVFPSLLLFILLLSATHCHTPFLHSQLIP